MTRDSAARARWRRRYLSLGWGEWTAAAVFAVVAATVVVPRLDARAALALWWALAPLLLVLVQAGAYWLLARSWVGRGAMPPRVAGAFRVCRVLGPPVLLLGAVGVLANHPAGVAEALLVWAVWVFGMVEYLNYYVVRLAYPVAHWAREVTRWRRPRLVLDLQAARGTDARP
ncbi:hypothetical protein [Ornithinicoccus hortensis]|uniref:hypothetical protein n=1 Tax=Ornithinicoccus hortensis TaxID=82346 RepID=UPI001154005C|nr:hypothetical protein [Ornithinicoccus hortensis]